MTTTNTNEFTTINAQDGVTVMALIVPAELDEANQFYDELQAEIDTAFEISCFRFDDASDAKYAAKRALLEEVHAEVDVLIIERRRNLGDYDDDLVFA